MIISIILVFIPYLLDDYSPEVCIVLEKNNLTVGNPPYYSMQARVNYTQELWMYTGLYEGCHSGDRAQMEACLISFPLNFTCMVDAHIDEKHPRINYVFTTDEMAWIRLKFTAIIGSIYAGFLSLFVFLTLFLWIIDKIGEMFLQALSDRDLKRNRISKSDFKLTLATNESDQTLLAKNPFGNDPVIFNHLAETALEKNEVIEWTHSPGLFTLLFSSHWNAFTFLSLLLFPIFLIIILFGVYFGVTYYWKLEGIILVQFCIFYTFTIFCLFTLLYALAAFGTRYYLTSTRAICIIRCLFTTWIYQFPYEDIDSIILQGYESGSIAVRSKNLRTEVKLFSSIPQLRFIEDFLNRKMSQYDEYDPDYEDAIHKMDQ